MHVKAYASAVVATALLPVFASADIHFDQRTSTYDISTGSPDFTGASALYSIYSVQSADMLGDTYAGTLSIKSGYQNFNVSNTGGEITTINPVTAATLFSFPNSNLNGTTTISYNTQASGFGSSFMQTGVTNGLNTLEFQGGGFGLLDAGKTFYLDMNIAGNWATQGTSTGDMQILGYNSAFSAPTITYSGGVTQIRMVDTNFDGLETTGPGLDFKLYGGVATTPTPESWLTFGGALGLLGLASRRKKSRVS